MRMAKLRMILCLIIPVYVITMLSVSAVDINAAVETTYSASQTMDIGIITGLLALAVSAVVIYFLRKHRR